MDNKLKHYRTTLMINGIIALIFGGLAIFLPQGMIKTIAAIFGIILLIGGSAGLWFSIQNMKANKPYISTIVSSVASIVLGLIIVFNTRLSLNIVGIIIGIWALVIGAVQLFITLRLLEPGNSKKAMLINSIITLLFGLLLFVSPFGSIIVLTRVIGGMAILFGATMLFFSFTIQSSDPS